MNNCEIINCREQANIKREVLLSVFGGGGKRIFICLCRHCEHLLAEKRLPREQRLTKQGDELNAVYSAFLKGEHDEHQ